MQKLTISLSFLLLSFSSLASEFEIQMIKGKVELYRGKITAVISKETELKNGDIIKTNKSSFLKFKVNDSVITIAPHSYYTLSNKSDKNGNSSVGKLLFGHLQAHFLESKNKNRKISSTTAALGIRGTKILLHVARNATEYTKAYTGKDIVPPSLKELHQLIKGNDLFTQVCCVYGEIDTKTKAGKNISMKKGDVINFFSTGSKFQTYNYQPQIIKDTIKRFKFNQ